MFWYVRRSLAERFLSSSQSGRLIRRIHAQNPIRGAIAQAQQSTSIHDTIHSIPAYSVRKTSQDRKRGATGSLKRPNPPKKAQQKQNLKSNNGEVNKGLNGDPQKTATDLKSAHQWERSDIMKLYTPPTDEELPAQLERKLKTSTTVYEWMKKPLQYLDNGLKLGIQIEAARVKRAQSGQYVRVRLVGKWHKHSEVAIGDGPTKEIAANNAALHLIMKSWSSPLFSDAVCVAKHRNVTQDVILNNKSAKVDVYDYAAQFDTVPLFETRTLPSSNSKNATRGYFTTVRVPGTVIFGESFHPTVRAYSEIGACMDFKKRAEELHQGETMMVKHINTLTSKTGEKFLQYCKMKQKDWEQFKFESKSLNGVEVLGQLFSGDRLLSECVMLNKTDAQAICYYLAARDMKAQDGNLWKKFVVYLHQHHGEVLKEVTPLGVWMNAETIGALRNRLHRLMELDRELEAFSKNTKSLSDEVDAEADAVSPISSSTQLMMAQKIKATKNEELTARLKAYDANPELADLRKQRAELPLNQYADDVKALFDNNDVCVLVGATGSGKTTQVPQFLLDQAIRNGNGSECNIICTQPRRIAAMSVAKRVAVERGERLRESVGYRVRFGNAAPEWGGSITYCTTGILLRQLQDGYDCLRGVSHIIVDEVHERDVQIDFLMVLLKRLLEARRRGEDVPPVKVILMSATIDTTLFRKYFGGAYDSGECPYIEIPGRMFPVAKFFLNDIQTMLNQHPIVKRELELDGPTKKYLSKEMEARRDVAFALQHEEEEAEATGIDWSRTGSAWEEDELDMKYDESDQPDSLLANTIAHLCAKKDDGAVLVFLPGFKEIVSLDKLMRSRKFLGEDFNDESKYRVFMLHSSIPTMQQDVFNPLKPGIRKIILSTNIAETSVTIPEVAYVVDTCKHREKRYSQLRRSTALICTWISQSSARQRAGRAGRVKAGEYYALTYPERHNALPMGDTAEIKRTDLQDVCLSVRTYGIKDPIADVLEESIEPPSSLAVVSALKALTNLGALDSDEKLTPLGHILSDLPVQPSIGKMVLLGSLFKCLDPILILAAIESNRSFFLNPPGAQDQGNNIRYGMALGQPSDHLALLNAFREWRFIKNTRGRVAATEYAYQNLMHSGGLQNIEKTAEQMLEMLVNWGLAKDIPAAQRYNNELGDPELNINSDVQPLIFSLLTSGLMPNLAVQMSPILLQTTVDPKAMIHPGSLNSNGGEARVDRKNRFLGAGPPGTLVLYSSKSLTAGGVFLRDTTVIGPMTGLMFSGKLEPSEEKNILYVDDWLPFKFENGVAKNVLQLTECVEKFLDRTWARLKVLTSNRRKKNYGDDGQSFWDGDPSREPVVKAVVEILERAEHLEKLRRRIEAQEFSAKRARREGYAAGN